MSEPELFLWPAYRMHERRVDEAREDLGWNDDDGNAFADLLRAYGAVNALHDAIEQLGPRVERVKSLADGPVNNHFRMGLLTALEMLTETHVEGGSQ